MWDARGHLVTNYHVIQGAKEIEVTLADGTAWPAEVVGHYPDKDVAVLRIQPKKELRPIPLGSSSSLQVGQNVQDTTEPRARLGSSRRGRDGTRRISRFVVHTHAGSNGWQSRAARADARDHMPRARSR